MFSDRVLIVPFMELKLLYRYVDRLSWYTS